MEMKVHELAFSTIEALAPLLPLIQRKDRALAVQLRTAACSMVLNIAESEYSDPGNRRARLFTAAGSTNESRSTGRPVSPSQSNQSTLGSRGGKPQLPSEHCVFARCLAP